MRRGGRKKKKEKKKVMITTKIYSVIVGLANNGLEWTKGRDLPVLLHTQTRGVVEAQRELTGRYALQQLLNELLHTHTNVKL